jgi:hypothetical protein
VSGSRSFHSDATDEMAERVASGLASMDLSAQLVLVRSEI